MRFKRREVDVGEVLIEQGRSGKSYFVMESGAANVVVKKGANGREVLVRTIQTFDTFGDLAMQFDQPRAATVTATAKSVVWEVDEAGLVEFLQSNPQLEAGFDNKRRIRRAMSRVHWFMPIIRDEIKVHELVTAFQSEEFEPGQIVIHQNDPAVNGKFYVILSGECEVFKGKSDVIARLSSGDSFGELALVQQNCRRNATVRAAVRTVLLSTDRQQFHRLARKGCHRLWNNFIDNATVVVNNERFMDMQGLDRALAAQGGLSSEMIAMVFEAAQDRTQKLMSWPEFVILVGLLHRDNAHYQLAFMFADHDQDGLVSRAEFKKAMTKVNCEYERVLGNSAHVAVEASEVVFDELFKESSSLTFDQFSTLLREEPRMANIVGIWDTTVHGMRKSSASWSGSAIGMGMDSDFMATMSTAKTREHHPWEYLFSGAVAGAVSRTAVSPLIRLKMIMQTGSGVSHGIVQGLKLMYSRDGVRGLFQGNGTNVVRIAPTSALQFLFFETIKSYMEKGKDGRDLTVTERLVGGGFAGIGAAVLTYPLDFIRARLTIQSQTNKKYNGIVHGLATVIRTEGTTAVFRGLWPTMLGVFPYIGIDFAVFETLKPMMPQNPPIDGRKGTTTALGLLFAGGVAGLISQSVAFPLELVRRRLQTELRTQVQGFEGSCNYGYNGGVYDALKQTVARDGVRGLYRGMSVNLVKAVPSISISFLVYEKIKHAIGLM